MNAIRLTCSTALLCLLCITVGGQVLIPKKTYAQSVDLAAEAELAWAAVKAGEHDRAIEILQQALSDSTVTLSDPDQARARIRHVQTYIAKAYTYRQSSDDREAQDLSFDLWIDGARELVVECLEIPTLRATYPEEDDDYIDEMREMFDSVRLQLFGSFEITSMDPLDATVVLSRGEEVVTLEVFPNTGQAFVEFLPIGPYDITISASGRKTVRESVQINPGERLRQAYVLQGGGGSVLWGVAATAAAGVISFLALDQGSADEPTPLPDPPEPPSSP